MACHSAGNRDTPLGPTGHWRKREREREREMMMMMDRAVSLMDGGSCWFRMLPLGYTIPWCFTRFLHVYCFSA